MDLSIAMLMAGAAMKRMAERKPATEEELASIKAKQEAAREIITQEQNEEMARAPRAYRRRKMKEKL